MAAPSLPKPLVAQAFLPRGSNAILVPLDANDASACSIPMAVRLAELFDGSLRFINIVDADEIPADELDLRRKAFGTYIANFAAVAALPHDRWLTDVVLGSPAETILEIAAGVESAAGASVGAIVLASQTKGGIHALLVGSTADKVVRGAKVPVLVIPVGDEGDSVADPHLGMIMVAIDGSDEAMGALAIARDLARRVAGKVLLVEAYNPIPPTTTDFGYYPPDLPQQLETATKEYLATVALPGEEMLAALGDATNVIDEAAVQTDADLVVMTSSGKGLAARLVLGSITDRVLHSLHRPLLVIPKPESD